MTELCTTTTTGAMRLEPSPLRAARGRGLGEGALWPSRNSKVPLTPTLSPNGKAVGGEGAKAA
jgi:hypothetical protein